MRKMKDSGIAWIGKIPEEWKIQRGKNILTILERPVKDDDGVITCFRDGEVTLRANRREEGFTFSDKEIGYQGIDVGDLVVHGMDGFAGAIGISDSRGKATPVLNVLDSMQDKRFLMYYLRCAAHCGLFLSLSTGIRVRSCDTNWNKLKNVLYLLPSKAEQNQIVHFLDTQCAHIDAIIEKTRASIEEYKKLKKAVITHAVTKGIRPNIAMKDSGVESYGSIQEKWDCCKLKYLISSLNSGTSVTATELTEDGYPVYGGGQQIGFFSQYNMKDTLVVGRVGARCGCVTKVDGKAWATDNALIVESDFPKDYLYYILVAAELNKLNASNAQPLITSGKVLNFKVPVCWDREEQKAITAYLADKCLSLDLLIDKKEQFVSDLEHYKKSVIFEYITGKKEVPNADYSTTICR